MKYIVPLVLVVCAVGCANPQGATALEQRDYVNKMHDESLKALYEKDPSAQQKIADAAGHAVFGYYGANLVVLATEGGYGVAIDHATGQRTYMKLRGGGLGLGVGGKDARAIIAFKSKDAFDAFVSSNGKWTFGGNADAIVKSGDRVRGGSRVGRSGEVEIFTVNKDGIALAAAVVGTRFYRDQQLNVVYSPGAEHLADTEWQNEFFSEGEGEMANKTPEKSEEKSAGPTTSESATTSEPGESAKTDPSLDD